MKKDDFFSDGLDSIDRERILLFAEPGVGKTYAILRLAEAVSITSPDAIVWIIDSDAGLAKLRKHEFPHLKNIKYKLTPTWREVKEATKRIAEQVKPGDWFCIDMIGAFWEMAQTHEIHEVYGESADDFLVAARQNAVKAARTNQPATLPQVDWNVIKKLHNDEFIQKIATSWPCHLLATTSADKLDQERDDHTVVSIFGQLGWKPDGEKRNSHRFDTVMYLRLVGERREFTTLKDRARPLFVREPFGENLWEDYALALRERGFEFSTVVGGKPRNRKARQPIVEESEDDMGDMDEDL